MHGIRRAERIPALRIAAGCLETSKKGARTEPPAFAFVHTPSLALGYSGIAVKMGEDAEATSAGVEARSPLPPR